MSIVDVKEVGCVDGLLTDRFGPSFGDIFDLMTDDDPVAIVNADIFMLGSPETSASIASLCEIGLVSARRTDVNRLGSPIGVVSRGGIDFIAFSPKIIPKTYRDPRLRSFQLGIPWWDYVIPILASYEAQAIRIAEPFLIHRTHEDRWDMGVQRLAAAYAATILGDATGFKNAGLDPSQFAGACVDRISDDGAFRPERLTFAPDQWFERRPSLVDKLRPRKELAERLRRLFSFSERP